MKDTKAACDDSRKKWGLLFPIVGLLALIWFLIRVIPKPSRATYPCQKVAMPLAFSFMAWVGGLAVSLFAAKQMRKFFRQSRWILAAGCFAIGATFAYMAIVNSAQLPVSAAELAPAFVPSDAPNSPIGEPKGIHPGRVVWAYDPQAATWDGETGNYWDEGNLSLERVDAMLSESLRSLSGEDTDKAAWGALFTHFNKTRGIRDTGYERGEKIAIKLNLNVGSGNNVHNSPQMMLALVRQLTKNAGIQQSDITFYDASRLIGDHLMAPCRAEFPNVRFCDRDGKGDRIKAEPALLKGHDLAGVTFGAKNHFGSVWRERDKDSWNKGWSPGNMHATIATTGRLNLPPRPMGTYNPLVELLGHKHLDGKTVLCIIESFYAADNQSGNPVRWQNQPFNNAWASSLFISQDPVAIESISCARNPRWCATRWVRSTTTCTKPLSRMTRRRAPFTIPKATV